MPSDFMKVLQTPNSVVGFVFRKHMKFQWMIMDARRTSAKEYLGGIWIFNDEIIGQPPSSV